MAITALVVTALMATPPPAPPDPVQRVRNSADVAAKRMRLGDALLRLGDLRGACDAYKETIDLLPTWWMPRLAIVRCGRFVGVPLKELIAHARFAVRARPQIPITHAQLGLVLEEAGATQEAVRAFETALRLNARDFQVRYRLGMLLARLKRPKAARRHLEMVLEQRSGHIVARTHLARIYEQLRMTRKAAAQYVHLAETSRFKALALSRLIRFYQRHGMRALARAARARYSAAFGGI